MLGGAKSALNQIGTLPSNWSVRPFDFTSPVEFVSELDVFVHVIHDDAIEAFGRNIAEAMAAGVPVICSPQFEECFGTAAVYAQPADVYSCVIELWTDEKRYMAQARRGQQYVKERCSPSLLPERIARYFPEAANRAKTRG